MMDFTPQHMTNAFCEACVIKSKHLDSCNPFSLYISCSMAQLKQVLVVGTLEKTNGSMWKDYSR